MARGGSKLGAVRGRPAKLSTTQNQSSQADSQLPSEPFKTSNDLQQRCLNIFREAFNTSPEDTALLQEVKGHLYNRDFAAAFGKAEYLSVYASRWSASRALGYLQIFHDVADHIQPGSNRSVGNEHCESFNVLCIGGGGGAEVVALSAWLSMTRQVRPSSTPDVVQIDIVDIADWTFVMEALRDRISKPPELSKYASEAKKDANNALLQPSDLSIKFHQQDVLSSREQPLKDLIAKADLVTFMFTLNELFSTSMPKTQRILSHIMDSMRPGCALLIVDSPGSYSTVSINGAEKKYPMKWVIDYSLLGPPQMRDGADAKWTPLVSDDSRWFRLSPDLEYPIELENMRYQIHLFRRLARDSA